MRGGYTFFLEGIRGDTRLFEGAGNIFQKQFQREGEGGYTFFWREYPLFSGAENIPQKSFQREGEGGDTFFSEAMGWGPLGARPVGVGCAAPESKPHKHAIAMHG